MIRLTRAIQAWGTPQFEAILKQEIEALDATQLPLQQGLSVSSVVVDTKPTVMILKVTETAQALLAKVGIFYAGMVAGCNCADDPTPLSENPEYCVVLVRIDKHTADTAITLLSE